MESKALRGTVIHPFALCVGVTHRFAGEKVVRPSMVEGATYAGTCVAGGRVGIGEPPAFA